MALPRHITRPNTHGAAWLGENVQFTSVGSSNLTISQLLPALHFVIFLKLGWNAKKRCRLEWADEPDLSSGPELFARLRDARDVVSCT